MNLKGVCAKLSTSGLPAIHLIHQETQTVIQSLPLVKASSAHRSFILGTWVKSYRPHARKQGIGEFYDKFESAIAESRWQDCTVVSDEDGYTVYAWVCGGSGQLYHCYVIPELRHKLISTCTQEYACGTKTPDLARPWPGRSAGRVNPYLLCKKETNGLGL